MDIRVIGNRKLSNLLLIDNAAYSFGVQLPNGVPILPFYDNKEDKVAWTNKFIIQKGIRILVGLSYEIQVCEWCEGT